jgi:hypothetical protein
MWRHSSLGYMGTMKEEIPESFWEALLEVKDKDVNDAKELYQTAMELAKKYKDERDKARTELEMWWDGGILHEFHRDELEKVERECDKYKVGHDRYEKLRRLNLREIKELYLKNLRTGEHFDILVDKL